MAALVVIVLLFVAAFVGPIVYEAITGFTYAGQDFTSFLKPPSADHWFGTTQIGWDVFAQTMRGLQKSLLIGLLVALISTGLAAVVGAFAGYFGGWTDRVLMWLVDLLLVIPSFLIVAIISRNLRTGGWIALVLLIARLRLDDHRPDRARHDAAASGSGSSSWPPGSGRLDAGHHLPAPDPEHELAADHRRDDRVATAIIAETGLSYFGFGVKPPDASLGTLIAAGTRSAFTYPWLFLFSGGILVLTMLAVSVLGDGLRDALDPSSKRAGSSR